MKEFFKSKLGIGLSVLAGVALLIWGGVSLFNAGQKSALEQELVAIDNQLAQTSSRASGDAHMKLLAKRQAIQELLAKL